MKFSYPILLGAAAVLLIFFAILKQTEIKTVDEVPVSESLVLDPIPTAVAAAPKDHWEQIEKKVLRGGSFFQSMREENLAHDEILGMVQLAKPLFPLSRLKAGTSLRFTRKNGNLHKVVVVLNTTKELVFDHATESSDEEDGAQWQAHINVLPIDIVPVYFEGTINSSLWDSAVKSGLEPLVIEKFAKIFRWQMDFSRQLRSGADWAFLIDEKRVGGKTIGYGPILIAQLSNEGREYLGVRYKDGDFHDYYDLDGRNLRGKFLKSPVRYTRISSRFTRRRFHPILKINRPHLGVDYAAKTGTPVYSVGDGRVLMAKWLGKSGKTIQIRHDRRYKTAYRHLSRFASNLKKGAKVRQGQLIGYVGSTGLATGPHLHFEFYEQGRFVDPLGIRFPRERSISSRGRKQFDDFAQGLLIQLSNGRERFRLASSEREGGMIQ